jgi:hypothetical protein
MKKFVLAALAAACLGLAQSSIADTPPAHFVDEAKLPFSDLPGLPAQQLWGVPEAAGLPGELS